MPKIKTSQKKKKPPVINDLTSACHHCLTICQATIK